MSTSEGNRKVIVVGSRRWSAWLAASALVVAGGLTTAGGAAAASGSASLSFDAATAKALRDGDVALRTDRPATARGLRISLPVADATIGRGARLELGGGLTLRHGKRSAPLSAWQVTVAGGRASVTARLGQRRTTILTGRTGRRLALDVDAGTARLSTIALTLTKRGAQALRGALGAKLRLPTERFATLRLRARADGPATPTTPTLAPLPTRYDCPLPDSSGQTPIGKAPTAPGQPAARPTLTGALPASGDLAWRFKQSFASYVTGYGGRLTGGTFAGSGSYERGATPERDRLVLDTTGTMVFCNPGHFFWIAVSDPTIAIDPQGSSRLTATVEAQQFGVAYGPWRTDLATLTPGTPTRSPDGRTVTWPSIGATLTADGASAFIGVYNAGADIDPIALTVSVPGAG